MSEEPHGEEHHDFIGLCQAIGFVVIHWALIEQQVDNWVDAVFHHCGGENLRKDKDIPRAFNQKRRFLIVCFKKLPSLAPFSREGQNLVTRLTELSVKRNDLIHGAITALSPVNGAFQYRIIGYEKQAHTLREFGFDLHDFSILERSLSDTLTEVIKFSEKLADTFLHGMTTPTEDSDPKGRR
jgi:hypothetical protein